MGGHSGLVLQVQDLIMVTEQGIFTRPKSFSEGVFSQADHCIPMGRGSCDFMATELLTSRRPDASAPALSKNTQDKTTKKRFSHQSGTDAMLSKVAASTARAGPLCTNACLRRPSFALLTWLEEAHSDGREMNSQAELRWETYAR